MSGCLRSIGCLTVLVIVVAAAWLLRDEWVPRIHWHSGPARSTNAVVWQPLTPEGAARAKQAVDSLNSKSGRVFANIAPADLAAYVYDELSKELPPSAEHVEATAYDRELWVRTNVNLRDLGDSDALGPLSGMLGDRQSVQFGGTLDIVHPGLAEYRVESIKVGDVTIPRAAIPRLLRKIERGDRPAGIADNALPLTVPTYIADVRIARGTITLYKDVR
ncbi:MAG TPA: hypothetical protein VFJ96_06640 [Gemmatimonadaceae bacterium]|nr:hypothetical protein [Gemmatimonadaceae bacterium]